MKQENRVPLLSVEQVTMCYHTPQGETMALCDISFRVEQGGFLAIVGPSGCGKSTILSLIAGLLRPSAGRISLRGAPVQTGGDSRVGYMLQHDHLFPWRTVWDNVCLGLEVQGGGSEGELARLEDLLSLYGLKEFRDRFPRHLSGGMRQRAALIRTLARDPELLLLDEPFSALDYQTRIRVSDDIAGIIRSQGKTAVLVTHDISEAISLADQVLVMTARPGKVQCIIPVELGMHGGSGLEKRQSPAFGACFDRIWKELNRDGD